MMQQSLIHGLDRLESKRWTIFSAVTVTNKFKHSKPQAVALQNSIEPVAHLISIEHTLQLRYATLSQSAYQ
jgi:hypothetical protein